MRHGEFLKISAELRDFPDGTTPGWNSRHITVQPVNRSTGQLRAAPIRFLAPGW